MRRVTHVYSSVLDTYGGSRSVNVLEYVRGTG